MANQNEDRVGQTSKHCLPVFKREGARQSGFNRDLQTQTVALKKKMNISGPRENISDSKENGLPS